MLVADAVVSWLDELDRWTDDLVAQGGWLSEHLPQYVSARRRSSRYFGMSSPCPHKYTLPRLTTLGRSPHCTHEAKFSEEAHLFLYSQSSTCATRGARQKSFGEDDVVVLNFMHRSFLVHPSAALVHLAALWLQHNQLFTMIAASR